MKPKLLKIHPNLIESFTARRDLSPAVNNIWHYHEEIELIYICKGEGTRFVGENISRFRSGEIVLLGSNLPHYWRFDQEYFEENGKIPDVYVIHFNKNFFGEKFINLPENKNLKKLFSQTDSGLVVRSKHIKQLIQLIIQIVENEENYRLMNLLNLLYTIANDSFSKSITSSTFRHEFDKKEQERMQDIYNYTFLKFKEKISLDEIASVAKLSPNSFCKFFKSNTKKNYTDFVNEIRIGHACRLLVEGKLLINEICFESGFHNFTTFHKCFKKIIGQSPLQYQKSLLN